MSPSYIDRKPVGGDRRVGARAEQKRRWDREHARDGRCTVCSGPMDRQHDFGVCRTCVSAGSALRRAIIAEMWEAGASYREIAQAVGTTANTVRQELIRMRSEGVPLHKRGPRGMRR